MQSNTQQTIDNAASHWGWARTEKPEGNANVHYTVYERGDMRVVVNWTPAGRVGSYDVLRGHLCVRFGLNRDQRKLATVLTELAAEVES